MPGERAFLKLCRKGRSIPVRLELPADTETPVSAFLKVSQGAEDAFLFESVEGGERIGRWSFLGARPRARREFHLGDEADFREWVRARLRRHVPVAVEGTPRMSGGVVGYIGYDCVRLFEPRVPRRTADELGFPDAVLCDYDTVVAFDNLRHAMQVVAEVRCDEGDSPRALYADARRRIAEVVARLRRPLGRARGRRRSKVVPVPGMVPRVRRAEFEAAVREAREKVLAGDCQQIVVSQRFDVELQVGAFDVYRALRRVNPSPYLFFVRNGERALVGSSPETLVRLEGEDVVLRPIAGTRRRGATPEEDGALERELRGDEKENAEHVMLVDLGRNDVGRVARVGSVKVETLKAVERYSHVMHLVSQVRGKLQAGKDALDVLAASFPAGTVTGSPKVRAMELIDALEPARRGPYAGAVGYFDRGGDMELAIAIRTVAVNGRRASVQAGAGVVADSEPSAEYQETLNKARALVAAIARAHGAAS
ncbi:MAG TPA: chorismate-binding protein [Myxococcaceae bacterium]|nr:chorismate-binding protein [Myxococcaceae bacterium]